MLPILDQRPNNRPQVWRLQKILQLRYQPEIVRPSSWKNPGAKLVAPRDQGFRGTCTGQSTAYCFDLLHLTLVPGDKPTPEDMAVFKRDVVDVLGTTHDILYRISATAEGCYQDGRKIGNIHYPEGGETQFNAQAWIKGGIGLESMWHTDKTGKCVWQDNPRKTTDGGLSRAEYDLFAKDHVAEGYAMLGDDAGTSNFDEICDAIYKYGFVLAGIPVYENYTEMSGGDGSFPEPRGEIAGYHALCYYGYDEDTIYLLHSWGTYCSTYGSVSRHYTNTTADQSVYLVVIDKNDVAIARENYKSLLITCNVPAQITVNDVLIGMTPQKISIEPGKDYIIAASAEGYLPQTETVDDSTIELHFVLEPSPLPPDVKKNWWQRFIDWLINLFKRL